eukprot:symbB.v1.2.039201.t1/scaffold6403.1/size18377/1
MTSDDMEDCPAVDLEQLLNDARRVAEADPFGYLSLPQAGDLRDPLPSEISFPYHPWDWYICLHEPLIFMVNVGCCSETNTFARSSKPTD